jgi:NAD-dependent deacetylase
MLLLHQADKIADMFAEAVLTLRSAKRIAVLTGAGISAESGIPTFRDALTGLWQKFNPEDLATPSAFHRDPALVSQWYNHRRCSIAQCSPNPGHVALAELEQIVESKEGQFTLITQNVDRLHQAAGSKNVIELHGTLWMWCCLKCGTETEERGPQFDHYPLRCFCGGVRRPGVVWFGEALPSSALKGAEHAANSCELFLSIGTSSVVYPAAGLIGQAMRAGAKVLEVNPHPTPFSAEADWSIRGTSGEILPQLLTCLRSASPV